MIPCKRADCYEWTDPAFDYCAKHRPKIKPKREQRGYDALEVAGIGIVTSRRILAHRPKSVRRSTPVNIYTDYSYSMMRDETELSRRKPRNVETHGKSVSEVNAERRARTIALLKSAQTQDRHNYNEH